MTSSFCVASSHFVAADAVDHDVGKWEGGRGRMVVSAGARPSRHGSRSINDFSLPETLGCWDKDGDDSAPSTKDVMWRQSKRNERCLNVVRDVYTQCT